MDICFSAFLSRLLVDRGGGYRRSVLRQFRELQRFDRLSRSAMDRHMDTCLAAILNHARDNSPFYRGRIPCGVNVGNVRDILRDIPMLAKRDIQQHAKNMLVPGFDCFEDATGGSTGEPTVFFTDVERKQAGEAATYWSNSLAGFEYGDRVAMLWGASRDLKLETGNLKLETLRCCIRNWIENVRWYDAFDMGKARMADFHKKMKRFSPHLLVAYAGSLFEYARFLENEGIIPEYPLKGIVSSAEVLTSKMRDTIENTFKKPVYDRYGNREFGPIAAECHAHDGLHINEYDMLVQINSPEPYKIPGEIIVTYFANRVMPFIRYNTGDVGVFATGKCTCGRKTKRIKAVDGRASDSIRTRDGKVIHGEYFTHMMYGCEGVKAFQFVQEELGEYVLRVVCDPQISQMNADSWKETIGKKVGRDAIIRIETVDEIPVLPSGKRKFTVSNI